MIRTKSCVSGSTSACRQIGVVTPAVLARLLVEPHLADSSCRELTPVARLSGSDDGNLPTTERGAFGRRDAVVGQGEADAFPDLARADTFDRSRWRRSPWMPPSAEGGGHPLRDRSCPHTAQSAARFKARTSRRGRPIQRMHIDLVECDPVAVEHHQIEAAHIVRRRVRAGSWCNTSGRRSPSAVGHTSSGLVAHRRRGGEQAREIGAERRVTGRPPPAVCGSLVDHILGVEAEQGRHVLICPGLQPAAIVVFDVDEPSERHLPRYFGPPFKRRLPAGRSQPRWDLVPKRLDPRRLRPP